MFSQHLQVVSRKRLVSVTTTGRGRWRAATGRGRWRAATEVGVLKRYKQRTPESRQLESSPSWHRYSEHPCRRPGLYVGRGLVGGVGHFHAPPLGASIAEQRRRWAGQQGRDVCGGGEAGGLHYGQCSRDSTSQIQPSKATYTKHDGAGKRRARRAQGLWGALGGCVGVFVCRARVSPGHHSSVQLRFFPQKVLKKEKIPLLLRIVAR